MAKKIKYRIATEIPHNVVVTVPLLDEEGNPVQKEIVTPVMNEETVPVLSPDGEPLLDENGEAITETITVPVYDENGEPVVEITYEPVFVEEVRQEIETKLTAKMIRCATEASLEASLPIAQREAYNGEYSIEGEFDPEPESTDDILNALLGVSV